MARGDEIRRMAYNLWEKEGRPEGRAFDHWLRAEAMWDSQHATRPQSAPVLERERRPVVSQPTKRAGPYRP
ncbi:MAG: DUF2934 domain-containing protein [Thermoplasmata archaeon]|jgi:hypothetical protein